MSLADELTVCICTRERLKDLRFALESIVANAPKAAVVVSDDGERSAREVVEQFEGYIWQRGPGKGLGANRNAVVRRADRPWVLFIDDDARVESSFLANIEARMSDVNSVELDRRIFTGLEQNDGDLVEPHDVDFLGFQRKPYADGDQLRTVVINAALWPRRLFDEVAFDERLRYGSDEVDLSYQALAAGYVIELCPNAVNKHHPSPSGRGAYVTAAQVSRLRATTRRYWRLRRQPHLALAFVAVAPVHLLAASVRREGVAGILSFWRVLCGWLLLQARIVSLARRCSYRRRVS